MNQLFQLISQEKMVSKMIKRLLFSFLIILSVGVSSYAQTPVNINRAKILKTAEEKYGITPDNANISEQELIAELLARKVNINDEKAIEEAALEIIRARQKKEPTPKKVTPTEAIPETPTDKKAPPTKEKEALQNDAQIKIPEQKPSEKVKEIIINEEAVEVKVELPRIYGQDFPSSVSLQVDPRNINPKDSYIIGAGDIFSVSIYGRRSEDFTMTVNEDGYISFQDIPGGRVYVKGMTYGKAKKSIKNKLGAFYNFNYANLDINLTYARTVTVNIMGEVNSKGTQVITGVNTAFTALAASQGLTEIASVRNIKLIRSGESEKIVDIYKYMSNPTYGEEFYLQDNDYIIVPPAGRVITIKGLVQRTGRYELINGENLNKLIEYAAGLSPKAYTENVSISRVVDNKAELIDVNLQSILNGGKDFELKNGDIVTINQVAEINKNTVSLKGEFTYPGTYALVPNQRISYYVNKAQLTDEARTDTAYVIRKYTNGSVSYFKVNIDNILSNPNSAENFVVEQEDIIQVNSQLIYKEIYNVQINGEIRNSPNTFPYDSSLTIRDLIFLSGGLTTNYADKAAVIRTNLITNEKKYIFFSVSSIMNGASDLNKELKLQPKDEILILDESIIYDRFDISVGGAVRQAKTLNYDPNLTLKDAIYLAGGPTLKASNKVIIERTDLQTSQKNYIDVNLQDLLAENSSLNNSIQLKPSDNIQIIDIAENEEYTITVEGQVRRPGDFTWGPGLKLGDVITLSGGIKPEATSSRVEISRINIKPNGGETEVIVATFDINARQELVSGQDFELEKYDQVIIRSAPDFELQQNIVIEGEVQFPGTYSLLGKKETLLSVIERAGGLTSEAFPLGAKLRRNENGVGEVLLDLEDILARKEKSPYNYIMKEGDILIIPKATDLIVLQGAVDNPKVSEVGRINIPFHKGKRAGYYVNKYGQGVDRERKARRKYIRVEYANGDVKETINLGLLTVTPKVKQGSTVFVGTKPPKIKEESEDKEKQEPIDWGQVIQSTVTQITGVLTLYVLLNQVF